ncbi:MAG: putative lipid II flippase FtsW [Kineosporiaceae bacterium]|nr:putative lipid II flippase FtsW [Aeromicrobium sp.]
MSTTADRRTPTILAAARKTLERPLASYQLVLGVTSILLGLGLIMVLSASSVFALTTADDSFYIFKRQLIFAVLGVIGAFVAANIKIDLLRKLVYPVLGVTTLLILATFIPGVGIEVQGNRNWLPLFGSFQLQPSEFAKLAVVLWTADLFARKERRIHEARHLLVPMIPVAGVIAMLVVAQGDLGTALVLFAVIVGMLWVVGLPGKYMGGVGLTVGALLVFFVATSPHRVIRMFSFLNPLASADSAGFQSVHGMMALATGGFWGVGLGGSRQKWGTLPEAHTDFILAVIGEELGLIGTFVVIILFGLLAYSGVRIATRTKDPFVRYSAAGITIWVITQAAVNIAMVLGLLPVIGIPLPLISYGGSSLLVTLVALGLLVNFAKTEPGAKRALAASRKRRGSLRSRLPKLQRR